MLHTGAFFDLGPVTAYANWKNHIFPSNFLSLKDFLLGPKDSEASRNVLYGFFELMEKYLISKKLGEKNMIFGSYILDQFYLSRPIMTPKSSHLWWFPKIPEPKLFGVQRREIAFQKVEIHSFLGKITTTKKNIGNIFNKTNNFFCYSIWLATSSPSIWSEMFKSSRVFDLILHCEYQIEVPNLYPLL